MAGDALAALEYTRGNLRVLDQRKLPFVKEYVQVAGVEDAWNVIRNMTVRGAPLIAIVASYGLAVACVHRVNDDLATEKEWVSKGTEYLRTSRPTAVNLFFAMDEIDKIVSAATSASNLRENVISFAERLFTEDFAACRAMGRYGAEAILESVRSKREKEGKDLNEKVTIMTICNTGSLATAGYGTALGVVRALNEMGKLNKVYALETRPYNQGARLTAFEIVEDQLPGCLITDNMAAHVMKTKGVDAVVVGADRVVANGDTANKIGTYATALAALYHNVPFYVAAPTTTLDPHTATGDQIIIEERSADEVRSIHGVQVAPPSIEVFNPAFDVTPGALIAGIATEKGVARPTQGKYDIPSFLKA
jgi:S-methyl-5-thioribose-1-phosphate isomerase